MEETDRIAVVYTTFFKAPRGIKEQFGSGKVEVKNN